MRVADSTGMQVRLQYVRMISAMVHAVLLIVVLVCGEVKAQTIDPTMSMNISVDSGISEAVKDLLLKLHNDYRRDEKKAGNMNRLEWSVYLEQASALWVKKCDFLHQTDPLWGENLYRSTFKATPESTVDNGLLAWHLEQYNIMPSPSGHVDCCSELKNTCCHYTQMVWAATKYVGCAITDCPLLKGPTSKFDFKDAIFLACYYYPPGNVLTEQPYIRTDDGQCSRCPLTNPDCDKGLCYFETSRC